MTVYAKAIAASIVALAGYLAAVIPAEGGFADVSTAQWLGAVVTLGTAFGITAAVPNRQPDVLVRVKDGQLIAGEAARETTGSRLESSAVLADLKPVRSERWEPEPDLPDPGET